MAPAGRPRPDENPRLLGIVWNFTEAKELETVQTKVTILGVLPMEHLSMML
jgi:hypothetical protein